MSLFIYFILFYLSTCDECVDSNLFNCTVKEDSFIWIHGSANQSANGTYSTEFSLENSPGARYRYFSFFSDMNDTLLYLFGGWGFDSVGLESFLNNLWVFNTTIDQWKWISGNDTGDKPGIYSTIYNSSNIPGSRMGDVHNWKFENKLYVFGGRGYDKNNNYGVLNDIWLFHLTLEKWKWISGNDVRNQSGVYGTKGSFNISVIPGSRYVYSSWPTINKMFYIFGGSGYDEDLNSGYLHDFFVYNTTINQWKWINGNKTRNGPGIYGNKTNFHFKNLPGSRIQTVNWVILDIYGSFNGELLYMFGGSGYDIDKNLGLLNDLWSFNITSLLWKWISGNNTRNQAGIYGTKEQFDSNNQPGSRDIAFGWSKYGKSSLYLFGGSGYAYDATAGWLSDFFEYDLNLDQWRWVSGNKSKNQLGIYNAIGLSGYPPNKGRGGSWTISKSENSNSFYLFGGIGYDINNDLGLINDMWKMEIDSCVSLQCYTIEFDNSHVCFGHGSCMQANTCCCDEGWLGSECFTPDLSFLYTQICTEIICYGIFSNDSTVCNSNGNCISNNNCNCADCYYGNQCQNLNLSCTEITNNTCFGVLKNDSNVCSGHGVCNSLDTCICESYLYYPPKCLGRNFQYVGLIAIGSIGVLVLILIFLLVLMDIAGFT